MADEENQPHERGRGRRGDNNHNAITLGPKDRLVGSLTFEGDLTVAGTVEGELNATGDVSVENGSTVKAQIAGNNVSVQGSVTGNVTARGRLVLSGSGSLHGDVRVSKLTVEDGATLNGNVSMGQSVGGGKGPEAVAEEAAPEMVAENHDGGENAEQQVEEPQPEAVG
jgi:cytoskeletal protein CcmA (bactofilin family)